MFISANMSSITVLASTVATGLLNFLKNKLFLAVLRLRCCMGLSLTPVSRSCSAAAMHGLPRAVASLAVGHRLLGRDLRWSWLLGSRAQAQELWYACLVAPRHMGSSRIRAQTCASCISRWILYH